MTTVTRITSGSSLRPTVKFCTLARRRRNTPTIRSSAPCWSLANRTSVCVCPPSWGALACPARWEAACSVMTRVLLCFFNHAGNRRTGGDHRKHIGLRLDYEINNHRAFGLHCLMNSSRDIFPSCDTHALQTIGISKFNVVGAGDGCLRIVARVEKLLPLAHHAEITIVHNGNFDSDTLLL